MRLIDANALLDQNNWTIKQYSEEEADAWRDGIALMKKNIEKAPTIDPEALRPQWISIKDGLPNADEGDDFLAVSKNGNFVFEAYFERDCGRGENLWHDGCGHFYEVSHWMPLPEPPKEDEE